MKHDIEILLAHKQALKDDEATLVDICVITDSMKPLVMPNTINRFLLSNQSACPGDIVLIVQNNQLICHRIIAKFNGRYITKGDNCLYHDRFSVQPDQIIGFLVLPNAPKRLINMIEIILMKIYIRCPISLLYYISNYKRRRKW